MYLLKELKTPDERYQAIHGFDESQARGRPTENLELYANIPEKIKDYEILSKTYSRLSKQLEILKNLRNLLCSDWPRRGIYEFLKVAYSSPPALDFNTL